MDYEKLPRYAQLALRAVAPAVAHMPRLLMKVRYRRWTGEWPQLDEPGNLQEFFLSEMLKAAEDPAKLRLYADLADKYVVRDFVRQRVGEKAEQALTKLYGVWDRPEDIDFDALPVPCVIKTNNGCGTNIVVRSKADLNPDEIRRRLSVWLEFPYGELSGQPHYSAITPKIIAEEFLEQNPGTDDLPFDYKFFCFNGEPKFILFYSDRKLNSHVTYNQVYDTDWNIIEGIVKRPLEGTAPRPKALEDMVAMARELSKGFKCVRVDFYGIGKRAVFGEMTFSPDVIINFTPAFLRDIMKEVR